MAAEIRDVTAILGPLLDEYLPSVPRPNSISVRPLGLDDENVIGRIRRSKQAGKFEALWQGDTRAYGGDDSAADLAICSIVTFYADGPEQIDRIFRSSGLMRSKWDERRGADTYGAMTVRRAWENQTDHYKPLAAAAPHNAAMKAGPSDHASATPEASLESLFITARELAARTPEKVRWLVGGMLAEGCLTEIDAKVKVGKTTFVGHMFRSILDGVPFLGYETERTPLVLLTEEREGTITEELARCGLLNADDLYILSLYKVASLTWPDRIELAETKAKSVAARVIAIDTLSRWAEIVNENDTGEAQVAMTPLEGVASRGFAVLINRHDRKSGGEVGDSGRGASAYSGSCDIILNLTRANVEGHPNRRMLRGVGRFDDIPQELIIELQDGRYVNLGEQRDVERAEAGAIILDVLSGYRDNIEELQSRADLETSTGKPRATVQRALDDLYADKLIARVQSTTRGRPWRYWRLEADEGDSSLSAQLYQASEQEQRPRPLAPNDAGEALRLWQAAGSSVSAQPLQSTEQEQTADRCAICDGELSSNLSDGQPVCAVHARGEKDLTR